MLVNLINGIDFLRPAAPPLWRGIGIDRHGLFDMRYFYLSD